MCLVIVTNLVVTFIMTARFLCGQEITQSLQITELCFSCFYVFEIVCGMLASGPTRFFNFFTVTDCLLAIANASVIIAFYSAEGISDPMKIKVVLVSSALRFFSLIYRIDYLLIFFNTLVSIASPMSKILGTFLCTYFLFSFIGVYIFGGRLYEGSKLLKGTNYDTLNYYCYNFNDL